MRTSIARLIAIAPATLFVFLAACESDPSRAAVKPGTGGLDGWFGKSDLGGLAPFPPNPVDPRADGGVPHYAEAGTLIPPATDGSTTPPPPLPDFGSPTPPPNCGITDIPQNHPEWQACCWMVSKGVIPATGGKFDPNGTFTRGEMAKHLMMLRYQGKPVSSTSPQFFTDVLSSHQYYQFIQKLREDKITVGCNVAGTMYCPDDLATNAHAASLCVRMKYYNGSFTLKSEQPYFTDVATSHWGFKTIQKLQEDQANMNCAPGKFCPDMPITRIRWARLLYTYFVAPGSAAGGS